MENAMRIPRLLLVAALVAAFAACEQKPKTTTEMVKDKVNDALDRRPNEQIKDAAEDVRDGVKAAVKDINSTAK
jgi:ABC-type transporter MlaC component